MATPFKMKGMDFGNSPISQDKMTDKQVDRRAAELESRPGNKINALQEKIEYIQEDANNSGKPLTPAQKNQIATLKAQIAAIEAQQ